jgi:hypothetical protein
VAGNNQTLSGLFYGELDPKDPRNSIVMDIQFAPRNARRMASATFALSKPTDLSKSNGVPFYSVPNRAGGAPAAHGDGRLAGRRVAGRSRGRDCRCRSSWCSAKWAERSRDGRTPDTSSPGSGRAPTKTSAEGKSLGEAFAGRRTAPEHCSAWRRTPGIATRLRWAIYLRRMKAKLGPAAATTATAHKIATICYTMVKKQVEYDGSLRAQRDAMREKRIEARLHKQAAQHGYKLVPLQPAA